MSASKTELLVIGTIHQYHFAGYSLDHLRAILEAANPDVLCVEIRPADFEKRDFSMYPLEMSEVGVKWAEERGRPCCPIDWWREEDLDKREVPTEESLKDHPLQPLNWRITRNRGWRDITSPEFSSRCKKYHKIEGSIFDAAPSFWKTRNMEMSQLIDDAVRKYPGKRLAVLTGCEHKYWFDEYFENRPDVEVIQPCSLELRRDLDSDPSPEELLRVLFFYLEGWPANNFPDALLPDGVLDDLERLQEALPDDPSVHYLKGMYYYVVRDYERALESIKKASESRDFAIPFGPRRMPAIPLSILRCGHMCDLLGKHEEAVGFYRQVVEMLPEGHMWRASAQRCIEKPFTRPGTPSSGTPSP
ncbi:MAG: tetratricopeptide repeat protein [Bacillota bacterium]|jgi:hypothetical protein